LALATWLTTSYGIRDHGIARRNLFVMMDNAEGARFLTNSGWYDWPNIRLMSRDHPDPL
jgi:hypothetical protein